MTPEEEILKLKKNHQLLEADIQNAMRLIDALRLRLELVEGTLISLQSTPPSAPSSTVSH